MDTGNCLLIDSSMYINHKYSFREEVKYEVPLKKKALKSPCTFLNQIKEEFLVVANNE